MPAAWGVSPAAAAVNFLMEQRTQQQMQEFFAKALKPIQPPVFNAAAIGERAALLDLLNKNSAPLGAPAGWGASAPSYQNSEQRSWPQIEILGNKRQDDFGFGVNAPPTPPVGAPPAMSLIPDPVAIVKQNLWPSGFPQWGIPQKVGWLQALMHPYRSFHWTRDRLAQATGLLYQQAAISPNKPL